MAAVIKLTPQQQQIIVPVLGIVAIWIFYSNFWNPLIQKTKTAETQLLDKKKKLEDAQKAQYDLIIINRELTTLRKGLEDAKKQLPKTKEIPGLLRNLTTTAEKYQIIISGIIPQSPANDVYVTNLPFNIQAKASYHTLANFFTELGTTERIININGLRMNAEISKEDPLRNMNASFTLVTYIFKGN